MTATARINPSLSWTAEQPSSTTQEPAVNPVAQQTLAPTQNCSQVLNMLTIKLQHANDLLDAQKHSEAADAYRELYFLLINTTDIQGLFYRSFCLHCLAYCTFLLHDKINRSLIISALADLEKALLKLESSSDAIKQIQYYRAMKAHYEAFTTWNNQCDLDLLTAKIQECEEKACQIEMRVQVANQKTTPCNPKKTVLPLTALHDDHEFTQIFAQIQTLIDKYHFAEAGVHVLKFGEGLKDPLDPQKLIWRAHCNIQLSECTYRGRYNLDSTVAKNNQYLMIHLASAAFEDLQAAHQSLASRDIISSDTLRCDFYQRLHIAYKNLSRLQYWQTGAKVSELSQECLKKANAAPNLPQKEPSKQYSKIKIIFAITIGFLGTILAVSLYHRVVVKKYI